MEYAFVEKVLFNYHLRIPPVEDVTYIASTTSQKFRFAFLHQMTHNSDEIIINSNLDPSKIWHVVMLIKIGLHLVKIILRDRRLTDLHVLLIILLMLPGYLLESVNLLT